MNRKTALQSLLCLMAYPALKTKAQTHPPSANGGSPFWTQPTRVSMSFDHITQIEVTRGGKVLVISTEEIWNALAPAKP